MIKDEILEELSDKVRLGQPIGVFEAIAVIDYQTKLQKYNKENKTFYKIKKYIKGLFYE